MDDDTGRVAQRVVFYIPGFDPFPPRRYRELYRREGAEQARLSGYKLDLTPLPQGGAYGWRVAAEIEGSRVESRVEVLVWNDLAKSAMSDGILATYWQMLKTAFIYFGSGAIWPIITLRAGPLLSAFYPVVVLLGQLALALAAGWLCFRGGQALGLGWLGALLGLGAFWALMRLFKRLDGKIFAHYLMHDFAYVAAHRGAYPPDLEARLDAFRARLRAALEEGPDEVLVVGHSSGAHLALSMLGSHLRAGGATKGLSLLTIGQAVPMVAFLPKAGRLRADLLLMSEQDQIPWVDVSAPSDGACFALCDPVAVTGLHSPRQLWPLVLSAAFTQTLSPAKLKELGHRYFRIHFQYLCAFDRLPEGKDAYDYFRVTAGPLRLWDRFGQRSPSKSRITRAVSRHRSLE